MRNQPKNRQIVHNSWHHSEGIHLSLSFYPSCSFKTLTYFKQQNLTPFSMRERKRARRLSRKNNFFTRLISILKINTRREVIPGFLSLRKAAGNMRNLSFNSSVIFKSLFFLFFFPCSNRLKRSE